jgi:TPR repeat protein
VKWYTLAAKQGFANAQYNLGLMYANGTGVLQDYKTAVKWFRLAAKQGVARAQYNLGWMYANGHGVPLDYKTAVKWYRLAAKQGFANAQYNLGVMYRKGQGVPQNNKTTVKWYRLAAKQGFANAQYNLGWMYANGHGVPLDYKTAVKWYRLAAKQGHAKAQYNLGLMYAKGQGVPKDNVYAHMWWNIAASSGKKNAVKNRDIIAKKMTSSQLAKSQNLARNFVPTKSSPVVTARKSPRRTPRRRSDPNKIVSASSGSGFAVSSDGHVITNYHVINGCKTVKIHHKGKSIPATVVTFDPQNDLALLKGDFRPSTVLPLSTNKPELLQDVYVAGYPFGRKVSTGVKVTKGIISSLTGVGNNFSNIQIDAALQPGNSGGPILDDKGNVVGVAVARLDKIKTLKKLGSLPENTNFGIKTSVVRTILDSSNVSSPNPSRSSISKSKLGKMISDGTYYLSCWMTTAQIEKMRSKKVIFQNLN